MAVPVFFIVIAFAFACTHAAGADAADPSADFGPDEIAFYEHDVRPILAEHCYKCHDERHKGGLRLDHRQFLLAGGDSGPAISLDEPADSLLLEAINYDGYEMPPDGKLPAEKIAVLTRWVNMRAPWTPGPPPADTMHEGEDDGSPRIDDQTRSFWSFQPIRRPELPPIADPTWPRNPIDHFVLARLEQAGLKPNPEAPPQSLVRRATYNATGLPPLPGDADGDAAYEQLVDDLLASPRYGEKWARHWLDLVRFAETNSYERDSAKPNAWRYRDYVIDAFNSDKPYDQFIIEQLAGDELDYVTRDSRIATGYYRLGIWDDEPSDPMQALYDDLDDILTTTSQVFLGLTINCARCHEHKLDPIEQRDYYRFLAFFNGLHRYGGPARGPADNMRGGRDVGFSQGALVPAAEEQEIVSRVKEHQRQMKEVLDGLGALEKDFRTQLDGGDIDDFKFEQNREAVLKKYVPERIAEDEYQQYVQLRARQRQLRERAPPELAKALCVKEIGSQPRDTFVLVRGNPRVPGDLVQPGFPAVLGFDDPTVTMPASGLSSGRRSALAGWLVDPRNPLTARVIVNRIWQYHLGTGLVRSANNFGLQGDQPTHPALLDWLAAELIDAGWSLKHLQRLIMTSATYRLSSAANPSAVAVDPLNELFWRFDMRRLSAEEIRDSIHAVNGSLNLTMGGPSIYPIIPAEVLAGQSRPGEGWGTSSRTDRTRRSVYVFVKRSLQVPLLASFDGADTDFSCPVRFVTTQPTQALGLLNSEFVQREARVFAQYLVDQAGSDPAAQVSLCLRRTLQRQPTSDEIAGGVKLWERLQAEEDMSSQEALTAWCMVALNLNEFLYLD